MWSRPVTSDCNVGPNRDRFAVPEVLGSSAMRSRETRLSSKERRRQLSAIAYVFWNLERLMGSRLASNTR